MANLTYRIPIGTKSTTNTLDLAKKYGKNNSFTVIGNQENNTIIANIYGDSRVDTLQGEGGDDVFSASAYMSPYASVIVNGGTGTDYFFCIDTVDPSRLNFSRQSLTTKFSIPGADGSILNANILDTVEYLVFKDLNNKEYYFLTEDLAKNRIRQVTWQEVYCRTYGLNADWYLNGLDTYSWYHVSSGISKVLSNGQGNLTLTGTNSINGTGNSKDNIITGNAANNVLNGADGQDTLTGLSSTDAKLGRGTVDTLTGGTGNDLFVLGDSRGFFYSDGSTATSGRTDYARITDFSNGDKIQLKGAASDYLLKTGDSVSGFSGIGLYRNDGVGSGASSGWDSRDEFIALIQVQPGTSTLSLTNTSQFAYIK